MFGILLRIYRNLVKNVNNFIDIYGYFFFKCLVVGRRSVLLLWKDDI